MDIDVFIKKVAEMREYQKRYFHGKQQSDLRFAVELEHDVDNMICQHKEKELDKRQKKSKKKNLLSKIVKVSPVDATQSAEGRCEASGI